MTLYVRCVLVLLLVALAGCPRLGDDDDTESPACDGVLQPGEDPVDSPFDGDGDGFVSGAIPECQEHYPADALDCDDADPDRSPAATEVPYDGLDNDCDESTPDDDLDGDGWPAAEDCDDGARDVFPGAPELCNELDDDCDDAVDEGIGTTWYPDGDLDGFGTGEGVQDCEAPDGWVDAGGDCDDADPAVHPEAAELCNGADDDCDGSPAAAEVEDSDGDGVVDCEDAVHGWALSFDGDDQLLVLGSGGQHLTGAMTVQAWIKTTDTRQVEPFVLGKHSNGTFNGFFLSLNSYDFSPAFVPTWYVDGYRIGGTTALNDGAWHHLAGTYDSGVYTLYVDGLEAATGLITYSTTNPNDIGIGIGDTAAGCGPCFIGLIDEVSVWEVARSAAEVLADSGARLVGDEAGLLMHWDFDEGAGQVAADGTGNGWSATLGGSSGVEASDPTWVEESPLP